MSFGEVTLELLNGFGTTCLLFVVTWVLAIPFGILFCCLSLSKWGWVRKVMQFVIRVIRGTPLMLQIIVVFYVPGLLFNVPSTSRMIAVIVALVNNYAIYFSEIFRAGYNSVNKGQREASLVLGFNRFQMFFTVLLVQIIKK